MSASAESAKPPRPQFAPALQTIVELVRRIMHADVASILGYSLADKIVTWKAASGFTVPVDYSQPVFRPLGSVLAWRAHELLAQLHARRGRARDADRHRAAHQRLVRAAADSLTDPELRRRFLAAIASPPA